MGKSNSTTKMYIGKVFTLKNLFRLQSSEGTINRSELGEHVLITDENLKRVKTFTNRGKGVWISKYYLAKEIHEEIEGEPVGELSKVLKQLSEVERSVHKVEGGANISKSLCNIMKSVRVVIETLEEKEKI